MNPVLPVFKIIPLLGALLAAPLIPGLINKVKAAFAGRRGPPVLQLYFDLFKLIQRGAVFSRTTTSLLSAGPLISLVSAGFVLLFIPWGPLAAPLAFEGDLILVVALLGLGRFMTVLSALDTGSSFEAMGASREVQFAALTEPALLLILLALARMGNSLSLSTIFTALPPDQFVACGPAILLVGIGLTIALLVENCRIPFDDPNTHLELTMIHEVMVLDHTGPDLALILYGASLKLWIMALLLANLFTAWAAQAGILPASVLILTSLGLVAGLIGTIESITARLRLVKIPQLLIGAGACGILAIFLLSR